MAISGVEHVARDRQQWKVFMDMIMDHLVPRNAGNSLTTCTRRTLFQGVSLQYVTVCGDYHSFTVQYYMTRLNFSFIIGLQLRGSK
jgi:hypothetical protein